MLKVSLKSNDQPEDIDVLNYRLNPPNRCLHRASTVKSMLGTSMVIGGDILTPSISVLSAGGGIREAASSLTETTIMWVSVAILIILFQLQRFGTDEIGCCFAPILTIWFLFIGIIGFYNFVRHDPSVIKAINPVYILHYFMRNKKDALISLGGVVLCLTGSEALFGDLGHFSVHSIQLSTCTLVFPFILLAYTGQASYLRKHNLDGANAFYKSVLGPMYLPMFVVAVVAVLAAIIASQSMIPASAFSIVQQALALGCFPQVKIVHTSTKCKGQVYVPEINYLLMVACIGVTLSFKNTLQLGNAYGIAVVFVMTLTSALLILVMIMIWKTSIFWIITYVATIYLIELIFLSSVLYKFIDGGYMPLLFALIIVGIMYTWHYVYCKVPAKEGFLFQRVEPQLAIFRCIVRYGYKDERNEQVLFKEMLVGRLKEFIREDLIKFGPLEGERLTECAPTTSRSEEDVEREVQLVESACKNGGVIHLMAESEVVASKGSSLWKRVMVNYAREVHKAT